LGNRIQIAFANPPDGHEFVFVIEGEQTFEGEGTGTKILKAGEVMYTPPNVPHFGRKATDKPVSSD
jgi:quercetin dioxygenase-like cupin family protein